MTISMDKQYTNNGQPVRILCTDNGGNYPVITTVENDVLIFTADGKFLSGLDNEKDLKEVWTPTEGELCYFWDDNGRLSTLIVAEFYCFRDGKYYTKITGSDWKHCAPFDGTFPEGFVK